ncbi:MAG: TetR/AcrR family transcriptional regulator [Bulleidia sp.]
MSDLREIRASEHKAAILKAAEKLFQEKGYEQTTIDDISKQAKYSRRTIYSYYSGKEDILTHCVEQGLIQLNRDVEQCAADSSGFSSQFMNICQAIRKYQHAYPYSSAFSIGFDTSGFREKQLSETQRRILELGEKINTAVIGLLENAKKSGEVRRDVIPETAVYVLTSSIQAVIQLEQTKGEYLCAHLNMTAEAFMDSAFRQILCSVTGGGS